MPLLSCKLEKSVATELIIAMIILCFLGTIAGFLSGLLGLGGGVILVPGMFYILQHLGYQTHAMHIAVGTSLLTIMFTNTSSAYAHYKRGSLDLSLLKKFIPGIFLGVLLGTILAGKSSTIALKMIFASSQIFFGAYMLFSNEKNAFFKQLPRQPWFSCIAGANACLSTLMGIAGAVQNVVFMTICNVSLHQAIATAAAIGPIVAVVGSMGFLIIGWSIPSLPPYNIGYINVAMFLCVISTSMLTAPLGVKIAHKLPVKKLRYCFSGFMIGVAINMIIESLVHS